jgi:hypothetical protein
MFLASDKAPVVTGASYLVDGGKAAQQFAPDLEATQKEEQVF